MAKVIKWSSGLMYVKYGKDLTQQITVETAIMDSDVQCFHCGKNIKAGKLVFCARDWIAAPSSIGDNDWGEESYKKTFCSSNHAKLFAKNNNGI